MSPALQADSLLTEPHESPTTVKFIETQGRLVVISTGGGEGVHLGTWVLANPMPSPTASLRALQSPLQAISHPASDLGNELLTGPLFHQLPRELTQVRPGCPGRVQERRQRWFCSSPLGFCPFRGDMRHTPSSEHSLLNCPGIDYSFYTFLSSPCPKSTLF